MSRVGNVSLVAEGLPEREGELKYLGIRLLTGPFRLMTGESEGGRVLRTESLAAAVPDVEPYLGPTRINTNL